MISKSKCNAKETKIDLWSLYQKTFSNDETWNGAQQTEWIGWKNLHFFRSDWIYVFLLLPAMHREEKQKTQ